MRNISFSMTTEAFRRREKTVTRRLGWWDLQPGSILMGVEKGMGLGKGGKVVRLGAIKIVDVRMETLDSITDADCVLEGLPDWNAQKFIYMFSTYNRAKCKALGPRTMVNRIEFKHISACETCECEVDDRLRFCVIHWPAVNMRMP